MKLPFKSLPHFAFIESACPAFLSNYIKADIYVYTKFAQQYGPLKQRKIVVSNALMRYLKAIVSIAGFPCTFQSAYGIAYKFSRSKSVVSDGLLTEWLYQNSLINPRNFISVRNLEQSIKVVSGRKIIIGSNWYEFGTMSLKNYKRLLCALYEKYPDAYYFPHPRERRDVAKFVFGDRFINSNYSIEPYCITNGIPEHIIGFGSTAMVSLGLLAKSDVKIDLVDINPEYCNGGNRDVIDPYLLKKRGIKIVLSDLGGVIINILHKSEHIKIIKKSIFL